MENFNEEEIKFLLDCCAVNIKGSIEKMSNFHNKKLISELDSIMYQHELIHKLQSLVKDKQNDKKKNKLSLSGILTTPPEDVTPENINIISDDELRDRISNGTLDDPKLETTLFPNGRQSK